MGFSVSGATAIILLAFLISFGAFFTAATGTFDQIQDAQVEQTESNIDAINTNIEIGSAILDNSGEDNELTIVANNTGATTVRLSNTDLLIDGALIEEWREEGGDRRAEIDDDVGSDLWLPQQTLTITDSEPDSEWDDDTTVKLITEHGIAATATIEVIE